MLNFDDFFLLAYQNFAELLWKDYADWAWDWIATTLRSSDDFDYLFVAGHYQTMDVRGPYDAALMAKLLPVMKETKVSAWIQGHRHTLEHVQQRGFEDADDLHVFTIGTGALTDAGSAKPGGSLPKCKEVTHSSYFNDYIL